MKQIRDDWAIPPELMQPMPRVVRSTRSAEKTLAIIAVILIAVFAFPLFVAFEKSQHIMRLEHNGQRTVGTISQLYAKASRSGIDYYAAYSYLKSDDQISEVTSLSQEQYLNLSVGGHVIVVYQKSMPENSALEIVLKTAWASPWRWFFKVSSILIGVSLAFWLILFAGAAMKYLKESRLVRRGIATSARIVSETEIRGRYGHSVTARYQFYDEAGQLIDGSQTGLPSKKFPSITALVRIDAAIHMNPTVLFDPRNPSRKSILYPAFLVECSKPASSN